MSKLRKHFITVLAVLFCALLALSAALFIPKSKTVNAARQTNEDVYWTVIGSSTSGLDKSGNFPFDKDKLSGLYTALTGKNNYADLKSALAGKGGKMTSADFRTQQGGTKNVSVYLGGIKWDVVYMTTVRTDDKYQTAESIKGDVIVTLWQSADDSHSQVTVQWSDTKDNTTGGENYYPSNMYSTSLIRNVTLNAGGYVATNHVISTSPQTQNSGIDYSRFTMSTATDSLVKYLVQPKDVKYQEDEASIAGKDTYGYNVNISCSGPNDAYGDPVDLNWYNENGLNLNYKSTKSHYDDWKDDYLWLPSNIEAGRGNNKGSVASANVVSGIWQTNQNLRSTYYTGTDQTESWLRSGANSVASGVLAMGLSGESSTTNCDEFRAVRPAIHFNLTKAAIAAGGIYYDGDLELTEYDYDGDAHDPISIPEYKKLSFDTTDEVYKNNYSADKGELSASLPNEDGTDKTYTLSVTPDTNYFWIDTNGQEERSYSIKIKAAEMQVNFDNPYSVTEGDSLLQGEDKVTSAVEKLQSGFKTEEIKYIVLTYDDYLKSPAMPADTDSRWKTSDQVDVSEGTDFWVWYIITANYHKPQKNGYKVKVSADDIHISVKEGGTIPDLTYGDYKGDGFVSWLKGELAKILNVQGAGEYDPADYLADKELILRDDSNKAVAVQTNGYYPAGTYTVDFKDSPKWDTAHPTLTINKKGIVVKVVADSADGLKHVYGDNHAAMKIVLNDGSAPLADGEKIEDLAFGDYQLQKNDGSVVTLDGTTPVSKGVVIADVSNIKNYDVDFETANSAYEVTKRTVKLIVPDEEAPYGTDFTNYDFKSLSFADGESLVNNDKLANVITSITYSIESDAGSYDLDDILFIGKYDLNATATADNYTFVITGGKLTITQASFNLSGVKLKSAGYIYDGEPHPAQLSGDALPDEVSCTFRYVNYDTGEELAGHPTEVGLYLVYASFTHNSKNHKPITDVKAAYIRIAYTQEELNETYPPLPSDEDLAAAKDLAEKKTEAKKKLDEEAKAKKDAIDSNADMTAEDKKAAKEEIEKELAEGNAAIDSAKDAEGVNKAYDDGKKAMQDTVELAETKTDAKKDLEKEAKEKKDKIDADVNLTAEEKKAAKDEIDKQLEEGKKEIDKSTNVNDVEAAKSASKKDIEDYTEVVQKKGSAKSELDKAAQAKKEAIDNNPELTDEEKAAAKAEVDKELEEGKKAIDGANSIDGVQSAESSTKTNIENVKVEHTVTLDEKKSSAKSELEKAASKKKAEIDDNDELTDEEKEEAKAKVDSELQKGLNAIESAEDDEELSKTVSDRKTKIESINPQHKGSFPWWIIAVAAGVLLLAAVVIIVIKKRQIADGDDDFYDEDYDFDEEDFEEDDFADEDF